MKPWNARKAWKASRHGSCRTSFCQTRRTLRRTAMTPTGHPWEQMRRRHREPLQMPCAAFLKWARRRASSWAGTTASLRPGLALQMKFQVRHSGAGTGLRHLPQACVLRCREAKGLGEDVGGVALGVSLLRAFWGESLAELEQSSLRSRVRAFVIAKAKGRHPLGGGGGRRCGI